MIPIANLYYLLCYAWNRLDERDFVDIDSLPRQDLPNLIARILINGVKRLLRQGIDRVYISDAHDLKNPKGKFDLTNSLKRGLLYRNAITCIVDELSADAVHNRIILTTLRRLSCAPEIDTNLSHELRVLEKHLKGVSYMPLRADSFARVQLHKNNSFYRFLLHVCELCFFSLLADEHKGEYRFKDFIKDDVRMRKVFQDFVFNFFRIEQTSFSVSSESLVWDVDYADRQAKTLLPQMITDVCLSTSSRKIVIECKFSQETLQKNWEKLSARSEHLYQLFAYLKNLEGKGGVDERCEGLLLYPTTTYAIDFAFQIQGHKIRVVTIDLRKRWTEIRDQLLALLNAWTIAAT